MNTSPESFSATLAAARAEVANIGIGQESAVELALITFLTHQNALIEGVPGVAKTLLVRTLSRVLGVDTGRVQFTPDLMPADITGTNIFNLQTNQFTLIRGPLFTAFLLADEINRAPAKTQSALLQAMQERTVTIDRETYVLDENFTVFATQNPAESEGTYPLAKAQSALLQAMQERTVTIDRETYVLDENFTVFATQNPAESEGTYPLAEAQ